MAYDTKVAEVWGDYVSTGTGQRWDAGVIVYEDVSLRTATRCYYRVVCQAWSSGAMDVHANGAVGATNDNDGYWEGTFSNSAGGYFTFYQWDTWYGRDKAARSVSFWARFNVTGGFGNGTSTATATVTMPARPSWAVTYDANGGSGAPASQAKWAGEALTLSKTVPTRANHEFLGWATSAGGSVAYAPGATYSADAALALHAVWRLLYSPPSVALSAFRTATAQATSESPAGGYMRVSWSWSVDRTTSASNAAKSVACRHREAGGAWLAVKPSGGTTGASGSCYAAFAASTTAAHEVEVTVKDSLGGSTTRSAVVTAAAIPIDVANRGLGVGILSAAPTEGLSVGTLTLTDATSPAVASHPLSRLVSLLTLAATTTAWAYLWGSSESNRFVRWCVRMGVCYLQAHRVNGVSSSGWKAGTLPASVRPYHSMWQPATAWHENNTAQMWVGGTEESDGGGPVWLYNNGSDDVFGIMSWPIV